MFRFTSPHPRSAHSREFLKHDATIGRKQIGITAMHVLPVVLICRILRRLAPSGKSLALVRAVPPPQEGRFAIVTNVSAGYDGRVRHRKTNDAEADGKGVWS